MATDFSRRDVLWMSAVAAVALTPIGGAIAAEAKVIDAGAITRFAENGIYSEFQPVGFFVVRRGKRIVAQSSICTHKRCKVKPSSDGFSCRCHGSSFSVDGKVTHGPAKKDLPRYAIRVSDKGHLLVDMSRVIESGDFGRSDAYVEVPAAS